METRQKMDWNQSRKCNYCRLLLWGVVLWISIFGVGAIHNELSISAKASEISEEIYSGDWNYKIDENDNVIITGYRGNDTELTLDTIDGRKIIAIGKAAFATSPFTKITLSEGIERIEENAFYDCQNLKEIILPDSLISIENHAFYWCQNLKSIELPKNLKIIGDGIFAQCYINYIGLSEENSYFVKDNGIVYDSGYKKVIFSSKSEISCRIKLPDSVEEIGDYSFYYCTELLSIQLPDNLKVVGENAFLWCDSLEGIDLPSGIEEIHKGAFASCHSITKFILPKSVSKIGENILFNIRNLKKVEIEASLTDLKGICSQCYNLEKVQLPEGLKILNGFDSCRDLETITIPESVEVIEAGTFSNSGLRIIHIPSKVKEIQESAFGWANKIETITVSEENKDYYVKNGMLFSVNQVLLGITSQQEGEIEILEGCTRIGSQIFYKRDNITKITIPDTVTELGDEVFLGCTQLAEISIGSGVTKIGHSCFWDTAYYKNEENWESAICYLGPYAICPDGEEKVLRIREGSTLLADSFSSVNYSLKTVILPQSMQYIGSMAFWLCDSLENVIGGSQIKRIGQQAFYNNQSLKKIHLKGENITIEEEAFVYCYELKSVVIDAEKIELGDGCFSCSGSIEKMVLPQFTKSMQNMLHTAFVHEGRWLELVITNMESVDLLEMADTLFQNCGGMDIYVNSSSEDFADATGEWLKKNNVYFEDEFYNCRFLLDDSLLEWDVVKAGEAATSPIDLEEYYAVTEEGPVYQNISWDLNGDGATDTLSEQVYEHINANAIYQVLEQEHSWSVKNVIQKCNCVQNGIIEYFCSGCKAEKTEETVAWGHVFSEEWVVEKTATCTGTGIKSKNCIRVGCDEKKNVVPILPKGHTWDDGIVIVEPAVGAEGSKVYTCVDCGEIKEETMEALPTPTPVLIFTERPGVSKEPTESPIFSPEVTSSITPDATSADTVTEGPKPTAVASMIPTEGRENILIVDSKINRKNKLILQWNEIPDTKSYTIFRSKKQNKDFKRIKKLSGTKVRYTDKTVFAGKKYYYRVDALTSERKISSNIISIRVPLHQAPNIVVTKKKSGQNIKYIQIRIKKFTGAYVEIQYRKGSGKYHKIQLKSNHIKKMKGKFQIQYLSGGDMLSIRVRTYTITKKKKEYSRWSKVKKVII